MNKELEKAINIVRIFNQEHRYRDYGRINNAIDTVLQALESYQIKELQFLNNNLDNISATELQTILQPYYLQKENLKHKDKIINELKSELDNSISKEEYNKIKEENEMLKQEKRSRIIGKYGEIEVHDLIKQTLSKDFISKEVILDKIRERQFELQQEYIDFKDDIRLNTLQELMEGK